jgi:hypothetical protein
VAIRVSGSLAGWNHPLARLSRQRVFERNSGELRPARFVGTVLNITDKVEAAEAIQVSLVEKETLLREIHHRVKNNLRKRRLLTTLRRGWSRATLAGWFPERELDQAA